MNWFPENRYKGFVVSLDNDSMVTKDLMVKAFSAKHYGKALKL